MYNEIRQLFVIDYADVVWDNCTQYKINALEQIHVPVQIEAARITTEATNLVSLEMLYQETGWESLEKRTP